MSRSGFGTLVSGTTNTPEMNSSTVSSRPTRGAAPEALLARLLTATPAIAQAAVPRRKTQANVSHWPG
jgi:hypothetical protein